MKRFDDDIESLKGIDNLPFLKSIGNDIESLKDIHNLPFLKSIGNDIIALKQVNKQKTLEFRFYSKILSTSEQALYKELETELIPLEKFIWIAWSVKESAYKFLKRNIPELLFSPTKIIIEYFKSPVINQIQMFNSIQCEQNGFNKEFYNGRVDFGFHILYFSTKIYQELIFTVVSDGQNLEKISWGIKKINNSSQEEQSRELRLFTLKKLASIFPGSNLGIEKSTLGYPIIIQDQKKKGEIPCSFAHHEDFISYALIT